MTTRGDLAQDLQSGSYTHIWESMEDFNIWREEEERTELIQFGKRTVKYGPKASRSGLSGYLERRTWVCTREGTGGLKTYAKKHPDWQRKVSSKRTGCECVLVTKTYPGTSKVLGRYHAIHSHLIGDPNAPYVRLGQQTRAYIEEMLRLKVEPREILRKIHGDAYSEYESTMVERNHFVTMRDIKRMQLAIRAEEVRLGPTDDASTQQWINKLRTRNSLLGAKLVNEAAPPQSYLEPRSMFIAIQTPWQRQVFSEIGGHVMCIDDTHNVTQYYKVTLFTLLCRDHWGHGIPVAWLLTSNGETLTLRYWLHLFRQSNPTVPRYVMTDKNQAQISAIRAAYPSSTILLCWWHVLHAWQQHLRIVDHPQLWELLKQWIRVHNEAEFQELWQKIAGLSPPKFRDYLIHSWSADQPMWSAMNRQNRHVFEEVQTNMLIEAWHHVLKTTFLQGSRNRRMDDLLHMLTTDVAAHYALQHRRQEGGFEGLNIEAKARLKAETLGSQIPCDHVSRKDVDAYTVRSQSDASHTYTIDMLLGTCECAAWPRIKFCKHMAAVDHHFPQRHQAAALWAQPAAISLLQDTEMKEDDGHDQDDQPPAIVVVPVPLAERMLARAQEICKTLQTGGCATHDFSSHLTRLLGLMDDLLAQVQQAAPLTVSLPMKVKLAPNMTSAAETAKTLPHRKKRARQAAQPYSGRTSRSTKHVIPSDAR